MKLFVAEADFACFAINFQNYEVVSFANGENLGRIGDFVPAEVADVSQAVETFDGSECAESGKTFNFAADDSARNHGGPESFFFRCFFFFEDNSLRSDDKFRIAAFFFFALFRRKRAQTKFLGSVIFKILHVTDANLAGRNEHGVASDFAQQTAFDHLCIFKSEFRAVKSFFCFCVFGFFDVYLALGKRNVGAVLGFGRNDDRFDFVADMIIGRIVCTVDGNFGFIDKAVFLARDTDVDAVFINADDFCHDAFAGFVRHVADGFVGRNDIFHGELFVFFYSFRNFCFLSFTHIN